MEACAKVEVWLDEYSKITIETDKKNCIIKQEGVDQKGHWYSSESLLGNKQAIDIFKGFITILGG